MLGCVTARDRVAAARHAMLFIPPSSALSGTPALEIAVKRDLRADRAEEERLKADAAAAAAAAMAMLPDLGTIDGLGRCTACGITFSDPRGPCYSHPGTLKPDAIPGRGSTAPHFWTCCGAAGENAKGCRRAEQHTPCAVTAAALRRFPPKRESADASASAKLPLHRMASDPSFARLQESNKALPMAPPSAKTKSLAGASEEDNEMGSYTVRMGDSLASVALKHRMTREDLMRFNGLLSATIFPMQVLRVTNPPPETPDQLLARQRRAVRLATGCAKEEAAYYLSAANADVAQAVAMAKADAAWEEATIGEYTSRQRAHKMAVANAMSTRVDWARAYAADTVKGRLERAVDAEARVAA